MATNGNKGKPDLSDLKARLGLKPTGGKPGGPPGGQGGPPGGPRSGPPGGGRPGGPPGGGPPSAAQPAAPMEEPPTAVMTAPSASELAGAGTGAPSPAAYNVPQSMQQPPAAAQPAPVQPAVQQPVQPAQPQRPSPKAGKPPVAGAPPKRNPRDFEVRDVAVDESVVEKPLFSPQVLGLLVVMLVLGLGFGIAGSQAMHANSLQEAQTSEATRIKKTLTPIIASAKDVTKQIRALDSTKPQFDTVKALSEKDFVPSSNIFQGTGAALIGGGNVVGITEFTAITMSLKQLLKRHNYLTNSVDKKELEQLLGQNEILQGQKNFAVMYNYKQLLDHLKSKKDDKLFKPSSGQLVLLKNFEIDDEGKVEYDNPVTNSTGKAPVRGIVPLKKTEILKTGGQNALQRYKQRVEILQRYAQEVDKSTTGILDGLTRVIEKGDSAGSEPAAEEPAKEAPKAE